MASEDRVSRRLHPKLRMIANGGDRVNGLRAELSSIVASSVDQRAIAPPRRIAAKLAKPAVLRAPGNETAFSAKRRPEKRPKLAKARHAFVNVFIELERDRRAGARGEGVEGMDALASRLRKLLTEQPRGARVHGSVVKQRNFIAATVPVAELDRLKKMDNVAFVQPAEALKFNLPMASTTAGLKPPAPRVPFGRAERPTGKGVIVGIIDVGGFDFGHPDFLDDDGKTRFIGIWDQGGAGRPAPPRFDYGAALTATHLNAAVARAGRPGGLPAALLEPQAQQVRGSHGTHVASIAAGRSGVCPEAKIAAVLIDVPRQGSQMDERRFTFSDSSRIVHAVEYLLDVADGRPISINISLGTNGGAHDGSSGVSRWLDALLATEGRSICVAAGNAGQEVATEPNDIGWVMGRIHSSGRIPAQGLDLDLNWVVVGDSIADVSENELEIWYGAQDRLVVQLKPPDSDRFIVVEPRRYVENKRLASGTTVSIYNELYHPTNGCNYISVYLSPNLEPDRPIGVQAGVWKVRLTGQEIRDGRFHCWIERDDPYELDRLGQVRVFRFPSFFSAESNVDSHSVSSLACGYRVIAVGNLDEARQKINATSSQGPTREDRLKPDIAAPGTDIVAANGFAPGEPLWTSMSGTSMASPYVAGVIALLLARRPTLTAAQCLGILQRTARPLPGGSYEWRNDAGFGQVHPERALEEALSLDVREPTEGRA
ncbi:MAG: S8 family serine peptidase [Candidatus Rokuibacteriota bacterium]